MATEIELKAHVHDSEALKALLHEKAEYSSAFEKDDTYWLLAPGFPVPPDSRLRVRREQRNRLDGSSVSATVVTYKTKEKRDGMEVNDELEFDVNPGPEFEVFLKRMGCTPGISKRKRGWDFSRGEITAELVEIEGLGWFIEMEILAAEAAREGGSFSDSSDNMDKVVAEAREKLLGFLDELGISRDDIESQYYTEMLSRHVTS